MGVASFRSNANAKIALLKHERDEALKQQKATSEVLRVISSSPGELEPVFKAMLESALRICEAEFGVLMLYKGDGAFDTRVMVGAPPALVDALLHKCLRRCPVILSNACCGRKGQCTSLTRLRRRLNRSLLNWLARGHISACP